MKTWWGDEQRKNGESRAEKLLLCIWPCLATDSLCMTCSGVCPRRRHICHGCCHCKKLRKLVTVLEWFHALCSEKFLQWEQGDGKDSTCRTFPGQPKAAALQLVASWLPMKTDAFQRHNASNMLDLRYGEFIFQAWYQKNTYWRGSLGCVFWGLRPTKPMKSTCYTRICLMFTSSQNGIFLQTLSLENHAEKHGQNMQRRQWKNCRVNATNFKKLDIQWNRMFKLREFL